uniref:Uncharacterized protein n=1 Tax=Nelumbo nucifera TaxID=4432 RepID=A0A822Z5X3_NELNU|nr:TPA_asm: hypothetical protein HUJ06_007569 [Nelumbo nucifera]
MTFFFPFMKKTQLPPHSQLVVLKLNINNLIPEFELVRMDFPKDLWDLDLGWPFFSSKNNKKKQLKKYQ